MQNTISCDPGDVFLTSPDKRCGIRSSFANWRVLDPNMQNWTKSLHPDLLSGCPGVQDMCSTCPGVQDLASGCPGVQDLFSVCPG